MKNEKYTMEQIDQFMVHPLTAAVAGVLADKLFGNMKDPDKAMDNPGSAAAIVHLGITLLYRIGLDCKEVDQAVDAVKEIYRQMDAPQLVQELRKEEDKAGDVQTPAVDKLMEGLKRWDNPGGLKH